MINIVTLYGNRNFGNKLQNYALQIELEKILGKDGCVKTIIPTNTGIVNTIKKCLIYRNKKTNPREVKFLEFNKHINYLSNEININKPRFKEKCDYLVFGSDQVWNPNFEGKTNLFCGNFKSDAVKISYAASFGVEELENKYREIYKKSLLDFKNISVREDKGKEIVEELTGRKDVSVVIDPTMLLTSKEWDKVSKKPKNMINKKYILNYFLGNMSEDRKKEIEKIAKENDCEIINIMDPSDPFYQSGPSEFLYFEKNAFLICTDSFHSSVFAILYNRPFIIFDREDNNKKMNSRLDTLLKKFNLKDRRYNGKEITKENLQHDYSEAYTILEKEREKSEKFFKNALGIEDRNGN